MTIQFITVPVEIEGEFLVFWDKQGNPLFTKKIHRTRLMDADPLCLERIRWNRSLKKQTSQLNRRQRFFRTQTAWNKKIDSLAKSFFCRSKELRLPKTRKRFESYPTHTWDIAFERMIQQGRSCYVYHCHSPWTRWLTCVCKNNNRRGLIRYGKNNKAQ